MSVTPPPQNFAAYPRGEQPPHGTADHLQALADGYFGLNYVFILNLVIALGSQAAFATREPALIIGAAVLLFVVVACCSYPCNKRIAFGLNWKPSGAIVASVLMGINSALACGIIGYIVMQTLALSEMKRYGLKTSFFSFRKKVVMARVAEMRQAGR